MAKSTAIRAEATTELARMIHMTCKATGDRLVSRIARIRERVHDAALDSIDKVWERLPAVGWRGSHGLLSEQFASHRAAIISVRTSPGSMTTTRTPSGASSRRRASERPTGTSTARTACSRWWRPTLDRLAGRAHAVRVDIAATPAQGVGRVLSALMTVGRRTPHRYRLMFAAPVGEPAVVEAAVTAAERTQDEFLAIVGDLVGVERALRVGALLLASVHGITDMEVDGHLGEDKWQVRRR